MNDLLRLPPLTGSRLDGVVEAAAKLLPHTEERLGIIGCVDAIAHDFVVERLNEFKECGSLARLKNKG